MCIFDTHFIVYLFSIISIVINVVVRSFIISFFFIISLLKLCDRSTNPRWNESFYFLVHDPKHQMLIIKVRCSLIYKFKDLPPLILRSSNGRVNVPDKLSLALQLSSGWDQPMGSLVVPVKLLLAEPQLVLDQWFPLDGALPESQILLRAELKVGNRPHLPTHALTVFLGI